MVAISKVKVKKKKKPIEILLKPIVHILFWSIKNSKKI